MQFDLFEQTRDRVLEAEDYPTFKECLISSRCGRCELSRSRTHIVADRGDPEAEIVFIGEAPGENEDREGRAFVGRAGKLLDELLSEIGIDTSRDVLIVNIVKCRPPENRAPRAEETAACLPYLKKQLSLVKPRVMVLLGATAVKSLIYGKGSFSMEQEVGRIFRNPDFPGTDLMVLYHPAFLLYDPRKQQPMRMHLRALKDYLEKNAIRPLS
ncbi:MAG TPA: uracil-DNA glycosylase [Candidatus Omnitrophota bacterium]|nr:uracil-DNA glycosylase [Candidatus Omnitrophota bacterium]